jgi:intracellular septation protein A
MTQPQQAQQPTAARLSAAQLGPRFAGLLRNLIVSVALPLIAVQILQHYGVSTVVALSLAAIFPAAEALSGWFSARRVDMIGLVSLASIVVGVGASVVSGDVRFALVKESSITGLFGMISLGSLRLAPRPLMFYLGREFVCAGDSRRTAEWDRRWHSPFFRTVILVLTTVWGIGYVVEAGFRIAAAYTLPPATTIIVSPLLAIGVTAVLIVWSIAYGKDLMIS